MEEDMAEVIDAAVNCARIKDCLRREGITTVIRYYSRTTQMPEKRLTAEEAQSLAAAGFKLAVVHQDRQNQAGDFSFSKGNVAGRHAYTYGEETINQPVGSTIYFGVDFDASEQEIVSNIIPYFQGVAQGFSDVSGGTPDYAIGVYGSGLTCRLLLDSNHVKFAWLAGAMGWRQSRQFFDANRWHLKQNVHSTLCNRTVDTNEINPSQPDFGAFTLPLDSPGPSAGGGEPHIVIARSGLRLRTGPSTSFDVQRLLPFGTVVHVLSRTEDWCLIDLEGDGAADGFCHEGFLQLTT
jgi:glycoside hydrolase-like protein/SH3 domain-containing protein